MIVLNGILFNVAMQYFVFYIQEIKAKLWRAFDSIVYW